MGCEGCGKVKLPQGVGRPRTPADKRRQKPGVATARGQRRLFPARHCKDRQSPCPSTGKWGTNGRTDRESRALRLCQPGFPAPIPEGRDSTWRGCGAARGPGPAHGQRTGQPARPDPGHSRRGCGQPDRCRLAEGGRIVPRRHQGQCGRGRIRRGRADLHGSEQPEPAQFPVPRLPCPVGGLYRRQDQLDRSRPGRLQRAAPAVDRHRHGRFRHHGNGRAV